MGMQWCTAGRLMGLLVASFKPVPMIRAAEDVSQSGFRGGARKSVHMDKRLERIIRA